MKIWVVMAKVEELQARSVERVFNSKEKAEQYSEDQGKKEIRHLVNIGVIDRSIEDGMLNDILRAKWPKKIISVELIYIIKDEFVFR
jgi:hypothetical protein